jgi:hypothetical protein
MTRKFKALGLALIAVFAMSAVAASGAQAENIQHTFLSDSTTQNGSGQTTTNLTGFRDEGSEHIFTIDEGSVSTVCSEIVFEGPEVGSELDEVTVTPAYDSCTTSLGAANVTENHCAYVFDSDTTTHETPSGLKEDAPVDIECSGGSVLEIEVPSVGVKVSVGPQTGLHGVSYKEDEDPETEKDAVTVEATVEGIAWTCTPAFLCGLGGIPSSGTDGTYEGDTIVTGFEDDGEAQVETAKTTPNLTHGDPVNISLSTP